MYALRFGKHTFNIIRQIDSIYLYFIDQDTIGYIKLFFTYIFM